MYSRSLVLLFALAFTVAAVSAVTVVTYRDASCATESSLVTFVAPLNTCTRLETSYIKYTTCGTSEGITQSIYRDASCASLVDKTVLPGTSIGLCKPNGGGESVKYTCSSSSALSASVLALIATMAAVLL